MTNTATRPDRRPDWLQKKHAGPAPVTPEREWADQAIPKLIAVIGAGPRRIGLPEGTTPERAHQLRQALYDAAYKGHNRRVPPAEQLSLSLHVADPRTGRCAKCDQMGCKPSPGRLTIHALVNTKSAGRAHQAAIPRDDWDYDPLAAKPRQRAEEGGPEPRRRMFGPGTSGPVEPDPPRSRERGAPPPSHRDKPRQARNPDTRPEQPQQEGVLGRLRRTLG